MKKALLTGHGGFVAGSIAWQAPPGWEVYALSLTEPPEKRVGFTSFQFDLLDRDQLAEVFRSILPDVVFHTAALADIDYCQTHQQDAEAVNVGVTEALAMLCRKNDVKMVLCSTDSVFDGIKGMYSETDAPNPVNYYAETKVWAEQAVLSIVERPVITRLSLVMGLPVMGVGNSFLAKMISALESGKEVVFPQNEIRTPVDVITLGRIFWELAGNDYTGLLHLGGCTRLNRHDMACRIARRLGFPAELVTATDSNAMAGRARRPNDASLDNTLARALLKTPMLTLDEALELVLQTKKEQHHGKP